jgi:hypothetical protein
MSRNLAPMLAIAILAACGGGGKKEEPPATPWIVDCQAGGATVSGTFHSPNGTVPVVGARITLASAPACAGTTSGAGEFELRNVPAAPSTVTAEKGRFSRTVPVTPGTPVAVLIEAGSISIAYVTGAYDAIQNVVGALGFTPVEVLAADLATADLSQYDALLFNCGMNEDYYQDAPTLANIRTWVEAGGVLYASDWAAIYVDALYPGEVNYLAPNWYEGMDGVVTAQVVDATLKTALGKDTAQINFNLGGWVVVDSISPGVTLLIRGPAVTYNVGTLPNKPFAAQFVKGAGRVTYTSFHEEAQTTADMDTLLEQMLLGL